VAAAAAKVPGFEEAVSSDEEELSGERHGGAEVSKEVSKGTPVRWWVH